MMRKCLIALLLIGFSKPCKRIKVVGEFENGVPFSSLCLHQEENFKTLTVKSSGKRFDIRTLDLQFNLMEPSEI